MRYGSFDRFIVYACTRSLFLLDSRSIPVTFSLVPRLVPVAHSQSAGATGARFSSGSAHISEAQSQPDPTPISPVSHEQGQEAREETVGQEAGRSEAGAGDTFREREVTQAGEGQRAGRGGGRRGANRVAAPRTRVGVHEV